MRNTDSFLRTATGAAMLVASLLAWPVTGAAQLGGLPLPPLPLPTGGGGTTQTVTGIATAVQAYSLGTVTTLASTGTLSDLTDARQASRLTGSVPALLSAETRSEEHTSELQSHSDLVCRLLLEKKNRR